MTDSNRTTRSRRLAGAIRLAALGAMLGTVFASAACTQIKETAGQASAKMEQWFGTGSDEDSAPGAAPGTTAQTTTATATETAAGRLYLDGLAYYSGTGVERDYAHAVKLLTAAASQGHAEAQLLLGRAFANGRGVAKNRAWAARWYGKAAAQGLREAQFTYGVVRASGLGLPKSKPRGYAWLLLATRAGHKKAGEVAAALEQKLTPERLAKAKAWADQFKPVADSAFADPATVMYLQQALNGLGFEAGPVDGILGKKSRAAISSYQKRHELPISGKLTPALVQRLFEEQNGGA